MWRSKDNAPGPGGPSPAGVPDFDEEAALQARYDRVAEEKRAALAHPGLSWREWFFYDGAKWFVGMAFLVVDAWIALYWIDVGSNLGLGLSIAAALYAEFLLYQFLWYRPSAYHRGYRRTFRPDPLRPVAFGRWTPEVRRVDAEPDAVGPEGGPDLKEFV